MMSFISYFINGLSLGSVYAIIALGYTMVYGIAKMLNFAHGDVIMIGGYVVFTVVSTMGLPPLAGILLAVIICTVLGVIQTSPYGFTSGCLNYSNRCQLLTSEHRAAGFWIQSEVLYISCYDSGFEACRRETDDFRGNSGYHRFLYRDYGGTDYLQQENECRAAQADSILR